jgi:hypothetical protein
MTGEAGTWETEYPERLARNLLIEFVGGELAAQLRDQFA